MNRNIISQYGASIVGLIVLTIVSMCGSSAWAQAAGETDVAQTMGVGLQSRFASGATPVQLSRTSIIPGTPMSVSSTMSNMMSGNNNSFGGILARYDTSNFGKFFGTGTLAPRTNSSRVDALDNLGQADNEVENIENARMYPPRLVLDFTQFPTRSLATNESRAHIASQVDNVLARFDFDPKTEEVQVENLGSTVYLRGKVRSGRMARLIENVIGLQSGVDKVVNELEIAEPETRAVDVFGKEL